MKCCPVAIGFAICVVLASCSTREGAPATRPVQNAPSGGSPQAPDQPPNTGEPPATTRALQTADSSTLPKGLLAQWSRFQTALKTDDTKLLAEVTRFPLESNEFGGDIRSADVLEQRYATIFPASTKQCLLSSTPKREEFNGKEFYEVYCDVGAYPIRFIFNQIGSQFFLTGIDNINE